MSYLSLTPNHKPGQKIISDVFFKANLASRLAYLHSGLLKSVHLNPLHGLQRSINISSPLCIMFLKSQGKAYMTITDHIKLEL